jgi:PhnB protein
VSARLHPHLSFDGRCREAFELYAETLGAQVPLILTYGESPMAAQIPAEHHARVVHATLRLGDQVLTGADVLPEQYRRPQGSWVMLQLDTPAEAERAFAAFSRGGEVTLPMQETFWAPRFGMVVDRFGTAWIVQVH